MRQREELDRVIERLEAGLGQTRSELIASPMEIGWAIIEPNQAKLDIQTRFVRFVYELELG